MVFHVQDAACCCTGPEKHSSFEDFSQVTSAIEEQVPVPD